MHYPPVADVHAFINYALHLKTPTVCFSLSKNFSDATCLTKYQFENDSNVISYYFYQKVFALPTFLNVDLNLINIFYINYQHHSGVSKTAGFHNDDSFLSHHFGRYIEAQLR